MVGAAGVAAEVGAADVGAEVVASGVAVAVEGAGELLEEYAGELVVGAGADVGDAPIGVGSGVGEQAAVPADILPSRMRAPSWRRLRDHSTREP